MTEYSFTVPGYETHRFTYQPGGFFGGMKLFCDGQPVKHSKGKYRITLPNGEELAFGVKYNLDILNPKLTLNKQVITVTPSMPAYQLVLVYLPLILMFIGGALGGLLGGIGSYTNLAVFRGKAAVPVKIALSIAVTFVTAIVFLVAAAVIHSKIN